MAAQPGARPDLWKQAIDSLPASVIKSLEAARTGKRDVALAALRTAEEKRQLSLKKRWRIKKSSDGSEVIVRDVVEKVIYWIRRFRDIGDQIVQYDPGHAALPWAAFRFLLQSAINDTVIHSELVDDLEMISRLMARTFELEKLYLFGPSAVDDQIANALVRLYAATLKSLAKAIEFFKESTTSRLLKAPFRSIDEEGKNEILAKEAEVLKLAAMVDGERLTGIETQVLRLVDLSVAAHKVVEEQNYLDILKWLSQVPYSRHHGLHRESRVPGTGQWLLQHPDVLSWASASSCSMLLVHGIAGCGKTILSSSVIDKHLDDMANVPNLAPLAYFYCSSSESERERRTALGVLRSLARQLTLTKSPQTTIHSAVLAIYNRSTDEAKIDGFEIARPNIPNCLEMILAATEDNPATLVIDALDEIDNPKQLVDALNAIVNRSKNVIKVLITSRETPSLFAMLPSAQTIRITNERNKADIRAFATHAVTTAISDYKLLMGNVAQPLKERLIDALVSGASEMFLWVKLQLLHLCSLEHEKDVIAASTTPEVSTLNELYQAAYDRIQRAGKNANEIATRSLAWLIYAKEPLTIDAFLCAIGSATDLGEVALDDVLAICRGFVSFDKQLTVLRFAHHSVREFLHLQDPFRSGQGQKLLAMSCLSVCNDPPDVEITGIQPGTRFYDYGVLYFGDHYSAALSQEGSSSMTQDLSTFLMSDGSSSLPARIWLDNCKVAYNSLAREHPQKYAMELVSNDQGSSLFAICTFGFSSVLESVEWPAEFDWNDRNDHGHTALYAASFCGHTRVVQFLLDRGADSNIECGRFGSALHCAAYRGYPEVVKLLISRGADIQVGEKFESALHAACRGNQEEAALASLNGHETSDQATYDSALAAVSEAGFSRAIEKLQDQRSSQATDPSRTAKMVAKVIKSGKVANLKYLARKDTLVNIVPPGSVALSALHGHEAMIVYLLEQGLDIEEAGDLGSPLRCASLNGHISVCALLLSRGANVNHNGLFGNALHAACMKAQLHIAKFLLDAGADVHIKGGYYGTPLQAAAYQGHKEVVSLLVGAGADPLQDGFSKDSFHAAAEGGHFGIIQFLLTQGFSLREPIRYAGSKCRRRPPPARNILRESSPGRAKRVTSLRSQFDPRVGNGDTASDSLSKDENGYLIDPSNPTPNVRPYVPVRESPLEHDSDVRKRNYLLEAAAAVGNFEAVRQMMMQSNLLGLGRADVENALVMACTNGHQRTTEEILSWTKAEDIPLQKALQESASRGHIAIVRMLLAHEGLFNCSSDCLKAMLISSIASDCQIFHQMLQVVENRLGKAEVKGILSDCLEPATDADRADIIQSIVLYSEDFEHDKLISAMTKASKLGRAAAAKVIREALGPSSLSQDQLSECLCLAVKSSCVDIVKDLLRSSEDRRYSQRVTLLAADCGNVDVFQQVLEQCGSDDDELLHQSLSDAAFKGHEQICRLLLSKGIDPCRPSKAVSWKDGSLDRGGSRLERVLFERRVSSDASERDTTGTTPTGSKAAKDDATLHDRKRNRFNAVHACLSGFEAFGSRSIIIQETLTGDSLWQQNCEQMQVATFKSLTESVTSFEGSDWDEAICVAAKCCPPSVLRLMLDNGGNARARRGGQSALDFAIQRECFCFPALDALFQRGADDVSESKLRHLLKQAASHFRKHEGRPEWQGGLFSETRLFLDVFTSGPGAVAKYLLQRLPKEHLPEPQFSVMLQCAATAGEIDLVTLLLAHQVDVNIVGSYYGTALQGASRFGHAAVVELLLTAGADPDVIQGRHHTALRAAVLSGSSEIVNLLLNAGANTELSWNWSYGDEAEDDATPLQLAVQLRYLGIAQVLITSGADVNAKRHAHQPILIQACESGDIQLICAVLDAGAPVQTKGHKYPNHSSVEQKHGSAVHAAINQARIDIIDLLISKGFDLFADFAGFDSPLAFAASKGNIAVIEFILLQSTNTTADDTIFINSIKRAVHSSNLEAAEKLLHFGSNLLNEGNSSDILRIACSEGDVDVVELVLEVLALRGLIKSSCNTFLKDQPRGKEDVFRMILEYVPCTVDLFVEACLRGYEDIVKTGLEEGIPPDVVDSRDRPSLHFAAMHSSPSLVGLLLASGANPNTQHPTFGTPLTAVLEGRAAATLSRTRGLPDNVAAHIELLTKRDLKKKHPYLPESREKTKSYQQAQQSGPIVQLLLERGASSNQPPGILGHCLTLAAFVGDREIYSLLTRYGAIKTIGGFLHSPLVAAIEGDHTSLAREINEATVLAERSDQDAGKALCVACEKLNISAVKMLLDRSVDFAATNDEGDTPLKISLAHCAGNIRYNHRRMDGGVEHRIVIANLLLGSNTTAPMSDQDLVAAAGIQDSKTRTAILERMISRAENPHFPESAMIALIDSMRVGVREDQMFQRLLIEKRLQGMTTGILAAVERPNDFTDLLDYDMEYPIDAETLNLVGGNGKMYARERVELLLERGESFAPTESNIMTVLNQQRIHRFREWPSERPHAIETIFTRNAQLKVTEDMLVVVQHAEDLKILLSRTKPEQGLVTHAVMKALTNKYSDRKRLFEMLLGFDPKAPIPPEIATQAIHLDGLPGLERMWRHDPSLHISEDDVIYLVCLVRYGPRDIIGLLRGKEGKEEGHKLVRLLGEHRQQWKFTRKVWTAIDRKFREQRDLRNDVPFSPKQWRVRGRRTRVRIDSRLSATASR